MQVEELVSGNERAKLQASGASNMPHHCTETTSLGVLTTVAHLTTQLSWSAYRKSGNFHSRFFCILWFLILVLCTGIQCIIFLDSNENYMTMKISRITVELLGNEILSLSQGMLIM